MIYVDLAENIEEALPKSSLKRYKLFQKIELYVRKKIGILRLEKFEDKTIIVLPELNLRVLKNLDKILKIKCENILCISTNLKCDMFYKYFENKDIKIFDGTWLYKFLLSNIVFYIIQNKNEKTQLQEISILAHKNDEIITETINNLAGKVKVLNIVTTSEKTFSKLENVLYESKGIILNITNNYQKSLIKSTILINFDFSEEEINKYTVPKKCCIINFNKIKISSNNFSGINIENYETSLPIKYIKYKDKFKRFENNILYESMVFKRTSVKNILKELKDDEISITGLFDGKGRIPKSGFRNLTKIK